MSKINLDLESLLNGAVKKMVEQGGRCLDNVGACVYINDEDESCGVGWLIRLTNIPCDLSRLSGSVACLVDQNEDRLGGDLHSFLKDNLQVLNVFQNFHDQRMHYGRGVCCRRLVKNFKLKLDNEYLEKWIEMGD